MDELPNSEADGSPLSEQFPNAGDLPDPQTPALPNGSEAIERRHDRTVRYDKPDTDRHQFRRKTTGKVPKLKDVIHEVMKRNRVERILNMWLRITRKSAHSPCSTCVKLELTAEKFIVEGHLEDQSRTNFAGSFRKGYRVGKFSGWSKLDLGSMFSIRERSHLCPFCRLVIQSVENHPNCRGMTAFDENATCLASWEIDDRKLSRDTEGNIVSTTARTRRIRLHWPGNDLRDSFIVLVAPESWGSKGLFFGRPTGNAKDNPSLAKRWMDICHDSHGARCRIEKGPSFEDMRRKAFFGVIDVDLMCLTSLPENSRYIALSYTWGPKEPFRSSMAKFKALHHKGGLQNIFAKLPRIIREAIALVQSLGERYLWVDTLCIIQDSHKSLQLNIRLMDLIYGGAHMTICAADDNTTSDYYGTAEGMSSDVENSARFEAREPGLQGLSSSERIFTQYMDDYDLGYAPSITLMVSYLAETFIKHSRWDTRAWTFQERMLSKRCLIFVDGRMYFQCHTTTMCEDICSEDPDAGWSMELVQAPTQKLSELATRPIQLYATGVELYTSKNLSTPSDILHAFNGLGNLIGDTLDASLIYGLPNSHFDWALLWDTMEINTPNTIRHRDAQMFPSWAWCGWVGGKMAYKSSMISGTLTNLHEWLMGHTWIVWYIRDGHGSLRLVWDGTQQESKTREKGTRWHGYAYPKTPQHIEDSIDPYGRFIPEADRDRTRSSFNLTLMPEYGFSVHIEAGATKPYIQFPDLPYLQFWTWSAFLRLTLEQSKDPSKFRKLRRYSISDQKGDWCGTIVVDPGRLRYHRERVNYEFLAISRAKNFDPEENDNWTYYIPKEEEQSEWDLYYVLLIETVEVDELKIARRLGLGKVFIEAFENSCEPGKQWKEFILG